MHSLKYLAIAICLTPWAMSDALAQESSVQEKVMRSGNNTSTMPEADDSDVSVLGAGMIQHGKNRSEQAGRSGMQRDSSDNQQRAAKTKADILIESNR